MPDPASTPHSRRWTLAAVCTATFMLLLDIAIVNVALPHIQHDLSASLSSLQWVVDAYAISLAALLLTAGSVADRVGRLRVFVLGLVVFGTASLVCGLAPSSGVLAAARAVQGVGGAAMLATSLALIGQEFRGPELPGAIAAWSAAVGAGVAAGPLAGGVLTETLGWRSIFLVNVPISVVVVAVAATQMTNVRSSHGSRLDLAGLVTFSGGLCALVYALLRGNAGGWSSPGIVAAFAAAAVLAVAFVSVERRRAQPMFDLGLFRNRAFAGVSFATAAIGCGVFSMMLYLSLYMQDLLGLSALEAGVRLLAITLPVLLVPLAGARVIRRLPQGAVLGTGLTVAAAGLLALRSVTGDSGSAVLLPGLVAVGFGIGLANPAIGTTALRVVDPVRSGMASGISNTCRMAGFATGIAVLGALFEHGIGMRLNGLVHRPVHGLAAAVAAQGPAAVPPGRPALAAAAHQAFLGGLREILLIGALIALTGAAAAFTLIRSRDFHRAHATPSAQPPPPLPAVEG